MDDRIKIIIKNLSDGDIYSNDEIAEITDSTVDEVDEVLNDPSISKTCGDGSGVIYIMDIKYDTIVDGEGFRNTVYSAKCNHHCTGCHNQESWDIKNGKPITIDKLESILGNSPYDVTFSGGECLLQLNAFYVLAERLKCKYHKNIWLYTGSTFEELTHINVEDYIVPYVKGKYSTFDECIDELLIHEKKCEKIIKLLTYIDVLVDGRFEIDKRDTTLKFRGSYNQRVIDVQKSLELNQAVRYEME